MKGLSIEEKAKRYDEILARATGAYLPYYTEDIMTKVREFAEYLLPELKESEDEKIKKAIKLMYSFLPNEPTYVGDVPVKDIFAWLEKQGKKESCASETMNEKGDFDNGFTRMMEKEQKPTDKVEPKFKGGDWIVFNGLTLYIKEVVQGYYITISIGGIRNSYDCDIDKVARLWTIEDAKDGDVLSYNDGHGNDCIELIKSITDKKIEFWFCLTNGNRYEVFDGITPYTNLVSREDATPATKEQRDQLERAMTNAGYEWDDNKKELKKIEQSPLDVRTTGYWHVENAEHKPTEWTAEDKEELKIALNTLEEAGQYSSAKWLKNVFLVPQPKREWSEEDSVMYNRLLSFAESEFGCEYDLVKWLKSFKGRVQPKQELNKDNETFYCRTIWLLEQYKNSNSEVKKQSALSCINWLKSAIKHERIIKYKIGDRVRFFSYGIVFTISDIDEVNERYIPTSGAPISFYEELISAKGSLNKDDIKCGDYLTTENGTVIKVHDVDENERVHYFYYAKEMTEDGGDISNNFMCYCAILSDCRRATQKEIDFLEKWVGHKKYVWVENNVSPDDEEDD